jgi:hypothetical protein
VSLLLLAPPGATAGDTARVAVTATVAKRANLRLVSQPGSVVITSADIARGYVDVPIPAEYAVHSNSRAGYVLDFSAQGDFMSQILVRGLGSDIQLGPDGGQVVRQPAPGSVGKPSQLAVGFRFLLSEATAQGTYPWPMRLSVTPL